jgi:serine/threonine protein kinase
MLGGFPKSERFERIRRIGQGGMGVVYEAWDRERGGPVALKTLRYSAAGDEVLLFKNEFRALQDIIHPNLVTLHELFHNDTGEWFFTMDLVDGVDVLEYVRPGSAPWQSDAPVHNSSDSAPTAIGPPRALPMLVDSAPGRKAALATFRRPTLVAELDLDRLRSVLRQLSSGLSALHAHNKVHCDIKPSNILVRDDGRLVLLDFGLILNVNANRAEVAGTAAYMAPEQVECARIGPAADWYAVGVFLYEALTGRLPFDGAPLTILADKRLRDPQPPHEVAPEVPDDLDALCVELLRRQADARPQPHDVLRRLGADRGMELGRSEGERTPQLLFVGRSGELRVLQSAFASVTAQKPASIVVHGESGVGKSELVRQFSSWAATQAVVLAGRCYERESVPYKALDGVMDALSEYLAKLPAEEAAGFSPRDAGVLIKAFPVLRRVEQRLQQVPVEEAAGPAHELRARLFSAVRELLAKLAARGPLVLTIDDLQWADPDSVAMLSAIVAEPDAPAMLLVATSRMSDSAAHKRLGELSRARNLYLEPLPPEAAEALATYLLEKSKLDGLDARLVATEAGGHPLYIAELLRHYRSADQPSAALPRLDDVLAQRTARLPDEARTVVELLAVSGGPIAKQVAAQAAQLSYPAFTDCVRLLNAEHLVKSEGQRGSDAVEPYHDRVREAVLSSLVPSRRRECHERLARALEAATIGDSEALATHWYGAGDHARAAQFAVQAAAQAEGALAYDRAARLYRSAIEMGAAGDDVWTRLAAALVNAGRGAEAARAYQRAATLAEPAEAARLQEQAAIQLLRSGHIDAGKAALAPSLEVHGIPLPKSPLRAVAVIVSQQLKRKLLRPRFGFRPRPVKDVPADTLIKLDLCHDTAVGLMMVDQVYGVAFGVRYTNLALSVGEPMRVARAIVFEAMRAAAMGRPDATVDGLLAQARLIIEKRDDAYADGMLEAGRGATMYLQGRWFGALGPLERAIERFRASHVGVAWEIAWMQLNRRWALCQLGRLAEAALEVELTLSESQARGDRFAQVNAQSGMPNIVWLARDEPAIARTRASEASALWSQKGFHLQHMMDLLARAHIDLYEGDGVHAHRELEDAWPTALRAKMDLVQINRILMHELRGRTALAAAAQTRDDGTRRERLATATRAAQKLAHEPRPWPQACATMIQAQRLALEGNHDAARAGLERAEAEFDAQSMLLYAQSARWLRAHLAGGDEGAASIEAASRALATESVRAPDKIVRLFAPAIIALK